MHIITLAMTPQQERSYRQLSGEQLILPSVFPSPEPVPLRVQGFSDTLQRDMAKTLANHSILSHIQHGSPASGTHFCEKVTREEALWSRTVGDREMKNKATLRKLLEAWGARILTLKQSVLTLATDI